MATNFFLLLMSISTTNTLKGNLSSCLTQYAWGSGDVSPFAPSLTNEEYEEIITCIHEKIKSEYKDDETCRFYSHLLGKLLVLANQE